MDQSSQTAEAKEVAITESVLRVSWNIATEPKLYRELASNPYASHATQIMVERFPQTTTRDVVQAVILAEPEGIYDWRFRLLPSSQQEKALAQQETNTTKIQKQLSDYCDEHVNDFQELSKERIYDHLSRVVFESTDVKEVEQNFSQQQRRNFRLAISKYIEDRPKHTPNSASQDAHVVPIISTFDGGSDLRKSGIMVTFAVLALLLFYSVPRKIQALMHYRNAQEHVLPIETYSQRLPVRLKIPKINVDAIIQHTGLTTEGAMDVPGNTVDVGWYRFGPSPGERGNAVISGHFDQRVGKLGVFNNLDQLEPGDSIEIINDLGITTIFIIKESRTYDPGYADEVFFSNDNGTHLNLITCDGVWDKAKKSYSKRLVIFADILQ